MCSLCAVICPKLKDNFATTALLALKAVEEDPYAQKPDSKEVDRAMQDKLNNVDVLATETTQKIVVATLDSLFADQVRLNWLVKENSDTKSLAEMEERDLKNPFMKKFTSKKSSNAVA